MLVEAQKAFGRNIAGQEYFREGLRFTQNPEIGMTKILGLVSHFAFLLRISARRT
jgi:hypothetical protein